MANGPGVLSGPQYPAQAERREGTFERKLNELSIVANELDMVQRELEAFACRLLEPRPVNTPDSNKIAAGEPNTHEAKLDWLFRRLVSVRARLQETLTLLNSAV